MTVVIDKTKDDSRVRFLTRAANNNVSERLSVRQPPYLLRHARKLGIVGLPDQRPTSADDPGAFFGDNVCAALDLAESVRRTHGYSRHRSDNVTSGFADSRGQIFAAHRRVRRRFWALVGINSIFWRVPPRRRSPPENEGRMTITPRCSAQDAGRGFEALGRRVPFVEQHDLHVGAHARAGFVFVDGGDV
jgi:hypothetical protein